MVETDEQSWCSLNSIATRKIVSARVLHEITRGNVTREIILQTGHRFAIEPLRTALDIDDGSLDGWILHISIHNYQVGYRNQGIDHSKTTGVKGISVIEGNRLTIEAATEVCLWHRRSSTHLCRR